MKTPGHHAIITCADETKSGAKCLLALALLALLVLLPACKSPAPPHIVEVEIYCLDDGDSTTVDVLYFDPPDDIKVKQGGLIYFFAVDLEVELQFQTVIADRPASKAVPTLTEPLVLKGSGRSRVKSAWLHIKDKAPMDKFKKHAIRIPKTDPKCTVHARSDHPPIIVN